MRQDNDLVVCQGLTKRFGRQTALDRLDLNLPRGKFIGLLGPNGSGKTTMIKLINGLLTPTEGTVLVDGQAPGTYTHSIISYLPDRPYLSDWMRVSDLLAFFSDFYKDFDQVKADEMLKDLKIGPGQRLKVLSKGTKEKVQLILTMSRKAQLYVLDEPIAGVDPAALLEQHRRRVRFIHIKDYLDLEQKPCPAFTAIGTGRMDNAPVLSKAKEIGAEWIVVEQDNSPIDELESARLSLQAMRAWF